MKHANRVHDASLPKPIDAANTLLEPQRIPRQLDIDDQPAAMMQVQSLAGRIGRDEHVGATCVERIDRVAPHVGCEPPVNGDDPLRRRAEAVDDGIERVAVFGEHDDRLARDGEQSMQAPNLRTGSAARCQCDQALDGAALFRGVVQSWRSQHRIRFCIVGVIRLFPRQRRLGRLGRDVSQQGKPAMERTGDCRHRRCRPPRHRHGDQADGAVVTPARDPHRPRVTLDAGQQCRLFIGRADAQHMRAAGNGEADIAAASAEDRDRIAGCAHRGEVFERRSIARVRRRRDQHAPRRPRRDPRCCGAAIGAGRKVMRLVGDHEIDRLVVDRR